MKKKDGETGSVGGGHHQAHKTKPKPTPPPQNGSGEKGGCLKKTKQNQSLAFYL